jgi:hypothetical protein
MGRTLGATFPRKKVTLTRKRPNTTTTRLSLKINSGEIDSQANDIIDFLLGIR